MIIHREYPVQAGDYITAGEASADIKRNLKQLGVSGKVLKCVSVASYEVELNLVIHSLGGVLMLDVDSDRVVLESKDIGPGIPDIDLAMREGYSTANEEARNQGFGAGMGLPNMKRNADTFSIASSPAGTCITMGFNLKEQ
ncbi:MAG: anti-sigma regulatory factor [Clostridiales bacterium]|nr:anti-sigma regulatory factor [Clostridiales bacterium]